MSALPCPYCGSVRSQVVDSRTKRGAVQRRRKCYDCGTRYKTREVYEGSIPIDLYTRISAHLSDMQGLLDDLKPDEEG